MTQYIVEQGLGFVLCGMGAKYESMTRGLCDISRLVTAWKVLGFEVWVIKLNQGQVLSEELSSACNSRIFDESLRSGKKISRGKLMQGNM